MIIGISGKRGVGKSSAARHLTMKYGFIRVSFAEELRRFAKMLMPFKDNDLIIPLKKESKFLNYDWSPRDFMIHLGEFMRFHDPDYWLRKGLDLCSDGLTGGNKNYVFDDCRYLNEADAIRKVGGKIIRINRYEKKNPYGKNLDIPSETDLDNYKFDYVIHELRNGSVTELNTQVDAAVTEWLTR